MMMLSLVDVSNYGEVCGILVCNNDSISRKMIQDKVDEIKYRLENDEEEWMIQDIIENIPVEWNISWFNKMNSISI